MVSHKPNMAKLEMTDDCNGFCIFCFAGCNKKEPTPLLPLDTWIKISERIRKFGVVNLNLSGGELFMFPEFSKAVRIFKEQGFHIFLNTNGTYDVSKVMPFLDSEDFIIFSIHAHNKLQDKIMGVPGAFEIAQKNLQICRDYSAQVCINMVLTTLNYSIILDNFNYWNDRYNISKFAAFMPVPFLGNTFQKYALEINQELISDYTKKLSAIPSDKLSFRGGFQNLFLPLTDCYFADDSPDCAGGRDKFIVKANADIYPCDYFTTEKYLCGNILEDDIASIWQNGKGFKFFRDYQLPSDCTGCMKSGKCYGGCRAWTHKYQEGVFSNEKDFRCELGSAFVGNRINQ